MLLFRVSLLAGGDYSCPQAPPAGVSRKSGTHPAPLVDGGQFIFVGGNESCWAECNGKVTPVSSPIFDLDTGERLHIGSLPDMTSDDAVSPPPAIDKKKGFFLPLRAAPFSESRSC